MAWNQFLNQKAHDIAAFHDQLDEFEIQSHSYQYNSNKYERLKL